MLESAAVTALVEMSDEDGPLSGKVWGRPSPVLVGLSLHVEAKTEAGEPFRLLFDTSTSWRNLRDNAEAAGIDLQALDAVFISHWHYDHTAALPQLLRLVSRPLPVYAPPLTQPFDPIKGAIGFRLPKDADIRTCREPTTITEGMRTTGSRQVAFPRPPLLVDEHALALSVRDRPVTIIVGCSHAPLEWIVEQAAGTQDIGWLVGGFHFAPPTSEPRKAEIISFFRERHPQKLSPMHCSTRAGIERLKRELPEQFFPFGLGDRQAV
jgi:7,8-dihydropterin-6-yl-methyl-4-(beta-D-ribofuranosyl)aminobenzene 5'-phosphate synthase